MSDPAPAWGFPPPPVALVEPRKFQHGLGLLPIALFLATFLTTTIVGGLWYSGAILLILGAHEFGHYFACRWHNVDCTLPYFLPAPLPLTGTLGAVIKIREPFPSRRALFDIGVAGPLAGFVTLLPFLIVGLYLSEIVPKPTDPSTIWLGEPLLFKTLATLIHGPLPDGTDIVIHPIGFAAWFGMLATALNLLPFGQLDGGHLAYAAFGRRATAVSMVTLAAVLGLSYLAASWIAMAVMLTAMTWMVGLRHPPPLDDVTPLTPMRWLVALLAVAVFIGCFTPTPITFEF